MSSGVGAPPHLQIRSVFVSIPQSRVGELQRRAKVDFPKSGAVIGGATLQRDPAGLSARGRAAPKRNAVMGGDALPNLNCAWMPGHVRRRRRLLRSSLSFSLTCGQTDLPPSDLPCQEQRCSQERGLGPRGQTTSAGGAQGLSSRVNWEGQAWMHALPPCHRQNWRDWLVGLGLDWEDQDDPINYPRHARSFLGERARKSVTHLLCISKMQSHSDGLACGWVVYCCVLSVAVALAEVLV